MDADVKILKQIEYYFSDQNLVRDKFMHEELKKDDGWVNVSTLILFNRLKQLTTDIDLIANIINRSSYFLEVNLEEKKIRRKQFENAPEFKSKEFLDSSSKKTVYIKGFPQSFSREDLEKFFQNKYKILYIKMRTFDGKRFKGSILAEFDTVENASSFIQDCSMKLDHPEFVKLPFADYLLSKATKSDKKIEKKDTKKIGFNPELDIGKVLKLKDINGHLTRENIKEFFVQFSEVQWVHYNKNDNQGYVRFKNSNGANNAFDKISADKKPLINGIPVDVSVLEGDEEKSFWMNGSNFKKVVTKRNKGKFNGQKRKKFNNNDEE